MKFGLGTRQAPVNTELMDTLTLGNPTKNDIAFKIIVPPSPKFTLVCVPEQGIVEAVKAFSHLF